MVHRTRLIIWKRPAKFVDPNDPPYEVNILSKRPEEIIDPSDPPYEVDILSTIFIFLCMFQFSSIIFTRLSSTPGGNISLNIIR